MKKSVGVVLFVFIFLNLWISFGDTTIEKLEFGENQIISLSDGWTYVDAFWIKPDAFDSTTGKSNFSLDQFGESNPKSKVRGTLYKTFTIPESFVGKPLVINNAFFDESFDLYINEMHYEKSLSISKHQSVKDGYLFIPNSSKITIIIYFEQDSNRISSASKLYLGALTAYERNQYLVWLLDSLVLAFALVFFMFLIWQRVSGQVKVKGILFELLVLAFILNFTISEIEKTVAFSHFEYMRIQIFLLAYISTLFATYGYKGNDRFMSFAKAFGKIYLILFAAGVTIVPIHYMPFIGYGHLALILASALICNRYKIQWKVNLIFAYFLGMAYLNLSGIMTSSLGMLPILVILIYRSFSRTGSSEQTSKSDNIVPLKEAYGSDKTEIQFKEMVNAVEEGMMVLTSDLYIDHVYNEALQAFFDVDIKHRKMTDVIYQDDFENKLYAETILGRYFEAETESDKRLYLDLLSSKVSINGRVLSLKYKITKDPKYLVAVLVDQTEFQSVLDEKETFDLDEILSSDLELLEGVLNADVMKQEHFILVEESDFIELEKMLLGLPGHEKATALVLKMKHEQNQKRIKKYDQYISDLARKLGKKVNPIVVEGYESVLNHANCKEILKSVVYLMDNAIIHGIEKPGDRFRKNKSEYGTVKVKFESLGAFIEITVEDDGRGIEYNNITTDVETHLGMGLTQVKKEVSLQEGSLKIESKLNQFTRIIIRIPE
ncbi:ATP-binding protein [Fusibacter sp. 3D3]|uniref:ATP-binding protein n=1 Tax=Fusibacter sp. 3D3 TaxID=1048380 RepID=UPI000852904D|nr:ATP-binding protein [Fusibacter sp. 3D3]GAU75480.1 signal transduction histidine kinase CheA [Fusibacter sp. 3D3]